MLQAFKEMIDELKNTSSKIKKKEIIKKHCDAVETNKRLLYATLSDKVKYYITSKQCKKHSDLVDNDSNHDLFDILNDLASRKLSGYAAIQVINGYVKANKKYEDIIYNIIDRDNKCKTGASLVNSVYPGYIPRFKVALAEKYSERIDKVDFEKQRWGWTRKLDGLRCITIIKNNNVRFFTRKGNEFFTLDKIKEQLLASNIEDCVLDGEICIVDDNGNENFKQISKEWNIKNHTIENPKYIIFDVLNEEEFYSTHSDIPVNSRIVRYKAIKSLKNNDSFEFLLQNPVESKEHLEKEHETAIANDWEGLMIRNLEAPYKGKKSNDMLKVKLFHDMEFTVLSIETGPYQITRDGKEIEIETMTKAIVDYKGNPLGIGSGFSLEKREEYYKDPSKIIGHEMTVKYFEECSDSNGKLSLRFATVKIVHDGKRNN